MLLMIDNYDSFTYNLVQYFGELGAEVKVFRNDAITLGEIARLNPEYLVISPGPAAPAQAACNVESLPLRDKLAQLLMVGVRNAGDAKAVVADNHVGGIFIGSWTDKSMLTDGSLGDIAAAAGPLALAVSVDEEGGRVSRLAGLIGSQPSPRMLAQTMTPQQVHDIAFARGQGSSGPSP